MPETPAQRSQPQAGQPKYRILSLDGGGIYGLVTATWLRKLAEKQADFLAAPSRKPGLNPPSPDQDLFVLAGASSGAVNALLLARHERPREALLSGELEKFWKNAGVFSNTDPVTAMTSFWGVGAWFGTEDLLRVFNEYFGSMRLRDLHHNVLISVFDWSGHSRDEIIKFDTPMGAWGTPRPGSGFGGWPSGPSREHSWRPRAFTNFLPRARNNQDWDYRVADLAYAACAAPGFRAVRGGLADAASATVNPTVETIAGITYLARWFQAHAEVSRVPRPRASAGAPPPARQKRQEEVRSAAPPAEPRELRPEPGIREVDWELSDFTRDNLLEGTHYPEPDDSRPPPAPREPAPATPSAEDEPTNFGILDQMAVLSLGDGTVDPAFWLENFDFSTTQLMMSPTNPFTWNFYTPSTWMVLDAPTQNIDDYARALLGPNRYMRVNPQLLPIPTLVASGMARFPWYRYWLTEQLIPSATASQPSVDAVGRAARFLEQKWWLTEEQARAAL